MAQRNRHQGGNKRQKARSAAPPPPRLQPAVMERKPVVVYGKPFILLEDARKGTFVYDGGQWVQHSKSIAQCREDSQVRELPQKINGMTRYEVCSPVGVAG